MNNNIPENHTNFIFYTGKDGNVNIEVFNVMGQKVTTLLNEHKKAGNHSVKFDGSILSSGVYFYKIQTGKFIQIRKMLLVK